MHVKRIDDLTEAEWAELTPMERCLIEVIENVNNVARIQGILKPPEQVIAKIVHLTATVFGGPRGEPEPLALIRKDLRRARDLLQTELQAARAHYGDPDAYIHLERLLEQAYQSPEEEDG